MNSIVFCLRIRAYIKLCFSMKFIDQTTAFCRPSPGLQSFTIRIPGADAPGYYATAPMRGLRIRLAALAVNSSFGIRPSYFHKLPFINCIV